MRARNFGLGTDVTSRAARCACVRSPLSTLPVGGKRVTEVETTHAPVMEHSPILVSQTEKTPILFVYTCHRLTVSGGSINRHLQ
ncbi:hypothetical protein BaRGS_00037051 [Batillaria attramentaria]|uniref:Uncharacterized protein n=1 Tax=Batillaria attramentaria TaxID=370345 RepID=A0ABD0JA21_9CAEN